MRGSLDSPPIVITQSRVRMVLIVLGGIAFMAIGLSMAMATHATRSYGLVETRVIGWSCLVFFGLCTVSGLAQLAKPGTLQISPAGLDITLFAFRSMRTSHYDWGDIDHFEIISIGRGGKMVGWHFSPGYAAKSRMEGALMNVTSRTGGLSGTWPMPRKKLVALLNEALTRWGRPVERKTDSEIPATLIE